MDTLLLTANPDELRSKFNSLESPQDIADLLEIDLKRLYYHIYIYPEFARYTTFELEKKSGGTRIISAPVTALKIIQRKLNQVLLEVYSPKPPVHSFLRNRSVVTNAKVHINRRNILNIDLESFFPSINFGRVRGMFMGTPYNLNPTISTILAQICCFNNEIPQGAPTSPIISNMICGKLDSDLMKLAKDFRVTYTRYSDDITFSTNIREFPAGLATLNSEGQLEIGNELKIIIVNNGFQINESKSRLSNRFLHQGVTGITVNNFTNVRRKYVRQIRAMLHAWEKFSYDGAQEEYYNNYNIKHKSPWGRKPLFHQVVRGKIEFLGMVRGKDDYLYKKLSDQFKALVKNSPITPVRSSASIKKVTIEVITEGKTDWMHLDNAMTKLSKLGYSFNFNLNLNKYSEPMGDTKLIKLCNQYSHAKRENPCVFIFDRDNLKVINDVLDETHEYKEWDNQVFSMAIPVPPHRTNTPNISMEFYYKDEDLKSKDKNGRRLFFSDEFDNKTGFHKNTDLACYCREMDKIKGDNISIIDKGVIHQLKGNIALSKNDFAEYVQNQETGFNAFDVTAFLYVFNLLEKIATTNANIIDQ